MNNCMFFDTRNATCGLLEYDVDEEFLCVDAHGHCAVKFIATLETPREQCETYEIYSDEV